MTAQKLNDAVVVAHAAIVAWNEQLGNFEDHPWSLEDEAVKTEFIAKATAYADNGAPIFSDEEMTNATPEQAMRAHILAAIIDTFKENLP